MLLGYKWKSTSNDSSSTLNEEWIKRNYIVKLKYNVFVKEHVAVDLNQSFKFIQSIYCYQDTNHEKFIW